MSEQMKVWAHDYAMKHDNGALSVEVLVFKAWQYAEAMQAEADKWEEIERKAKREKTRSMLNDNGTFVEREGQHFDDVASVCNTYINPKEWQLDWDLAPQGYDWFFKNADGRTAFATQKPYTNYGSAEWIIIGNGELFECKIDCPLDWRKSLRKRPE